MKIKLDSKMSPGAADVLGELARQLYDGRAAPSSAWWSSPTTGAPNPRRPRRKRPR